jgi:hypothetical protein
MSWIKHTGCRYHTQDTNIGCGAAAAMMILAEIGVPYSDLDQDDLYTSNHDHNAQNAQWATDPYGLEWTLDHRRPLGTPGYVVYKPTSEAEGTRKIVDTLHRYNVSPAVLVFGCRHWIVVPGVQTDVEPVPGADYTVEAFWIHNPVHHAGEPPPPHDATDTCGSGGALGDENDFVTYFAWQRDWFTGCDYDDPAGSPQYLSVCDPEEPELSLPLRRELKFLADGRRLLVPEEAIKFSEHGLQEYQLLEDERVAAAVKDAQPGKPQPVLRLDQPNTYYYLVPWETKEGVTALAQVDARFGIFHSLHLREKPARQEFLSRDAILERMAYKRFELPEHRGRLVFYPEVVALSPTLVWQPCQESYSPHLPFYQYTIGENTIYVRVDGEVFTQLTTTGPYGD